MSSYINSLSRDKQCRPDAVELLAGVVPDCNADELAIAERLLSATVPTMDANHALMMLYLTWYFPWFFISPILKNVVLQYFL